MIQFCFGPKFCWIHYEIYCYCCNYYCFNRNHCNPFFSENITYISYKNSAKRDTRLLKGIFISPIYFHMGGNPKMIIKFDLFELNLIVVPIVAQLGPYVVRFISRDSPNVVHFIFRDSPYIVQSKCRDCPYVVHFKFWDCN